MSESKRTGPKWAFDSKFGRGIAKNPLLPPAIWDVALHPENKITLNEMANNPDLKKEIWKMGSDARKNRLLQETKDKLSAEMQNKLSEEMQKLIAEEEKIKSKKPRP